jgi:DNA-binding MarR family transcriptional regulator
MPTNDVANDLRIVLGQLVRRLRADDVLSTSHVAVLSSLDRLGAQTTSGLAAGQHMRPQSMAHTIGELEKEGLVERRPDSDDRRQVMVELTKAGRELLYETRRRREDWLAQAIDGLAPAEQKVLEQAIALLERLAAL